MNKDYIQSLEDAAINRLYDLVKAAGGYPWFMCPSCGKRSRCNDMHPSGPEPWSDPICGNCFEEMRLKMEGDHGQSR